MQKWEYLWVGVDSDGDVTKVKGVNGKELPNWKKGPYVIDYLNQLGNEGWEMVSPRMGTNFVYLQGFYFKRPKP